MPQGVVCSGSSMGTPMFSSLQTHFFSISKSPSRSHPQSHSQSHTCTALHHRAWCTCARMRSGTCCCQNLSTHTPSLTLDLTLTHSSPLPQGLVRVRQKAQWDLVLTDRAFPAAVRVVAFDAHGNAWMGDDAGHIKVMRCTRSERGPTGFATEGRSSMRMMSTRERKSLTMGEFVLYGVQGLGGVRKVVRTRVVCVCVTEGIAWATERQLVCA
jgi:hypothetical protein